MDVILRYWNSSVNEYWEVFKQKKHICPNRFSQQQSKRTTQLTTTTPTATRPTYYNTKKSFVTQPKQNVQLI